MIDVAGLGNLQKIVVMNPKGGCGKTTLATNLASLYAQNGPPPTLVDCDPQGFSMRWLEKRPVGRPPIYGVEAYDLTQPIGGRVRPESTTIIFDLPAAIPDKRLHEYTYIADSLLIPIVPSAIDVYSATRLIAELLLDQQLDRREQKLAIVANRVRSNTRSYRMLRRFLGSLEIPMLAALRDSQIYVHAAAEGIGICEMPAHKTGGDIEQLDALHSWLYRRRAAMRKMLSQEQRQRLIEETAYRNAQYRSFRGGDPMVDWLEAEREVDSQYSDDVEP